MLSVKLALYSIKRFLWTSPFAPRSNLVHVAVLESRRTLSLQIPPRYDSQRAIRFSRLIDASPRIIAPSAPRDLTVPLVLQTANAALTVSGEASRPLSFRLSG